MGVGASATRAGKQAEAIEFSANSGVWTFGQAWACGRLARKAWRSRVARPWPRRSTDVTPLPWLRLNVPWTFWTRLAEWPTAW